MKAINKPAVLNPITLKNTVGAELIDILKARGIQNYHELLGISDLSSKEKLSKSVLKKLANVFDDYDEISFYLNNFQEKYLEEKPLFQENYKIAKKNFTRLKKALPLMRNEFTDGYDLLDDILDYFGVNNEEEIFKASDKQAALFRKQNNIKVDSINLHVWLRRGELDFTAMNLPMFDETALIGWVEERAWEQHLTDPNYFKSLPNIFSEFGVALILVPYLENTVYGAVRWINDRPLIEISDRNRDLATCWFTLFHELGHVIKHKNKEIFEGIINAGTANNNEKEANKFANTYLFNGDDLRKAVFSRKLLSVAMTANDLAHEFGVHPIFAAYWLRRAQYNPTLQPHISIDFIEPYQ